MMSVPDGRLPRVLISVLNWNQFDMTTECLRSLEQLSYPEFKVTVVDNGSRSFPEEELTEKFSEVAVIRSDSNRGYAAGHKLVVDQAFRERFDLIWLLNNDVIVDKDALSELVKAFVQHGDGIYGSVQLLRDLTWRLAPGVFWELDASGRPDFSRTLQMNRKRYVDFFREDKEPRRLAQVSGSSMMIPLEIIQRHGFIADSYFLYSEETDYCLRLQTLGVPSILVPRSIIWHNNMTSSRDNPRLSNMLWYYRTRNAHVVARKYRRPRQYVQFLMSDIRRQFHGVMTTARHDPLGFLRSPAYYRLLGIVDAYRGRMGKRFAPDDFLD